MPGNDFVAVVLSAGRGERLGGICKGLLRLDDQPLVARQALAALTAGATHVWVVTGFMATEITQALAGIDHVSTCQASGTVSVQESARQGLQAAHAAYPHLNVALSLVDLPLITANHVRQINDQLNQHAQDEVCAVIPRHPSGQPGHPIMLRGSWLDQLPLDQAGFHLRTAFEQPDARVFFYETSDPAHFTDIDTPQDLIVLAAEHGLRLHRPDSTGR